MRRLLFLFLLSPVALSAQDPDCTILGIQDLSQVYQDLLDAHAELQQTVDSLQLVIENPPCGSIVAFGGRGYETVQIGDQCWFAENLRTTVYADGTSIPEVTDDAAWTGLSTGARCDYDNDATNVTTYGRLYNWYAVDDARGLCPSGWHVPTDGEWTDLDNYLGENGHPLTEGIALKATSGWYSDGNGTDDFGFSALPGGLRYYDNGYFFSAGSYGGWWSSSPSNGFAWYRSLDGSNPGIYRYASDPRSGFSVRCLRYAD
ncbi:fibrobacter succinogenes major paralogous domain-containing protein [Flavobacteriales bacterium]|nr:fibrobacter succinogenes major paralogous domain-containing protein [Flavobacteriales bacterium]